MISAIFTAISKSTAMLFGRFRNGFSSDFWLLNLDCAKQQLKEASSNWTKIQDCQTYRYGFTTVLEPVSRNLWVVGGSKPTPGQSGPLYSPASLTSEVLVMPLNPSLKDLAVATVARNTCTQDSRLGPDQLATQLRDEIVSYRAEIGGKYLCSQKERCSGCMPDDNDEETEEPPKKRARKS